MLGARSSVWSECRFMPSVSTNLSTGGGHRKRRRLGPHGHQGRTCHAQTRHGGSSACERELVLLCAGISVASVAATIEGDRGAIPVALGAAFCRPDGRPGVLDASEDEMRQAA
jgi:hypothetical protein